MSATSDAYSNHDFIRNRIDLLVAGVAWGAGLFSAHSDTPDAGHLTQAFSVDEVDLKRVALEMLLQGNARILATLEDHKCRLDIAGPLLQPTEVQSMGRVSLIEPGGDAGAPILDSHPNLHLLEPLSQLTPSTSALQIMSQNIDGIANSLSIQRVLIEFDDGRPDRPQTQVGALLKYQSRVEELRHNIADGLAALAVELGTRFSIPKLEWTFTCEWLPRGYCRLVPAYNVFRNAGITLSQVKDAELSRLDRLRYMGTIPPEIVEECSKSYEE